MSSQPTRVGRNLKANTGRIIRVEQLVGRLEKRIEKLEKQNAALKAALGQPKNVRLEKQNAGVKAEIAKLRARVDEGAKENKRLMALCEPVRALVKSFKQTPGAPFTAWRMWMVSTFRKQGVYRRQMFK